MPAATTLFECKNFALQNVWGVFQNGTGLRVAIATWKSDGLGVLDQGVPEQAEARAWLVPTTFAGQETASTPADETETDVALIIDVLSRTLERFEAMDTLTASQINDIIAAYNAAWA